MYRRTDPREGRLQDLAPVLRSKAILWIGLAIIILIVGLFGYRSYQRDDMNTRVAADIRSNPDGPRAQRAMLVWLEDGRMYPVNYLREGNVVFMGIDGLWWREFLDEGARVEMLIKGQKLAGHARTILDDPDYKADVFGRLRPTVPEWLPDWLNGKLVVITLLP
jgi:hypothetical protein